MLMAKLLTSTARRGPSVETPVPIRDRFNPGRIAIDERVLGRSRTSFGGSSSEPIEEALGRIIGDDGFNSFKTGVDSVNKTEFAEREKAPRSGLAEALAKSTLDVISKAKENIMQQQRAMAETLEQLEDTAEIRVQSDTAVARRGLPMRTSHVPGKRQRTETHCGPAPSKLRCQRSYL